jgi:hypothetical protein
MKRYLLIWSLLWLNTVIAAGSILWIGRFSTDGLQGWQEKSFVGETDYGLVEVDGRRVLRAHSQGSASGLYRELEVDLEKTPYLHWSWRVANVLEGVDERRKAGDDYAARVYVVVSGGLLFWKTRSLVYVWSSAQPAGSHWQSAYTANVQMLALRSGKVEVGQWKQEQRNVRADFKRLFGDEIRRVDAVAVMTDTDNSGQVATAWYGDIYFAAE